MIIKEMYEELENLGGFTTNIEELNQEQLDFLEENNDFDIDMGDLLDIIDEYSYSDEAEISEVYESPEEFGRQELEDLYNIPDFLYFYIDLDGVGNAMIDGDEGCYRLGDDKIAYISL